MDKIITFKCTQCGVDFSKEEGGLCAVCGKPFCTDHLYEVKENGKINFLCKADKGDRPGKRRRNPLLMVRRFFGSKQK